MSEYIFMWTIKFQSTPSYEGELTSLVINISNSVFQSTPSYEGEHCGVVKGLVDEIFQSTPSYEGEQSLGKITSDHISISIHSLIRGRTIFITYLLTI